MIPTKDMLFDFAPTAMLYFDDNLRLVLANRQAQELWGVAEQQMGKTVGELGLNEAIMQGVLADGKPMSEVFIQEGQPSMLLEYTLLRADEVGVLVTAMPVRDDVQAALAQELRASRDELQAVLDNIPISTVLFEPNGQIRYRNRASREWLGQGNATSIASVDDYAAQMEVYNAEGKPMAAQDYPISKVLAGVERAEGEMSIVFSDGREREMRQVAQWVRDANGQARLVVAVGQDITELVQLTKQVQESRDELQAVLDNMNEGVLLFDTEERAHYRNPAQLRLMGMQRKGEPNTVVHHTQMNISYPDGRRVPAEDAPIPRVLRGEVFENEEYLLTNLVGEQMVLGASGSNVRDEDGKVRLGILVLRDLTPVKELERLKDEFISITSHELRTPLTTIKGYAQVLTRRLRKLNLPEAEEMQKPLEMITERTERMVAMVGDLLDVSLIAAGRLDVQAQTLDLTSLVEKITEQVRLTSTHRFSLDLPDAPVLVAGEERLLEQVLINLVGNAMKYSQANAEIAVRVWVDDNMAIVSVRDVGIGVPKEAQARLFERFYRSETGRRTATGLGLGLYISAGIIRAHGGRIWVESEGAGKGSTFSFALPLEV